MKRMIWPYMLFALLGTGLAYKAAIEEGPKHEQGQAWETFKSEDIKSVSFVSPKVTVRFVPLSLSYGWIEFTEAGQETRTLLAGLKGKDFWFHLSPVWASKVLGDAKSLKLSDYGLESEDKSFTIELNNGTRATYRIGGRGFQSSDFFVLDLERQSVFLWDRMTTSLLERAPEQLAADSLSFLNPESLNKITLVNAADAKSRTLLREAKAWREGEKPVYPDEALLKWLENMSKLKTSGLRKTGSPSEEPLFSLALEGANAFHIRVAFDREAKVYVFGFGNDKPQILLDEKSFAPFYDEFRTSNFAPKI